MLAVALKTEFLKNKSPTAAPVPVPSGAKQRAKSAGLRRLFLLPLPNLDAKPAAQRFPPRAWLGAARSFY